MSDTPTPQEAAESGFLQPRLVRLCLKRGDRPYELQGDVCGDETCDQCGQSLWATDFEQNHRTGYKSDRNQNAGQHPDAVHLKTLCTGCKNPIDCYWPPTTTFGGEPCTAEEYMAKVLQSESVGIYCDDCMERMPDVKLDDLRRSHASKANVKGHAMNRLSRAKRAARAVWRWLHCLVRPGYVAHLEDIIKHVALHGAYQKGGYKQMTRAEKRTVDRLDRQPWSWE